MQNVYATRDLDDDPQLRAEPYLRAILETQPAALVRLGADGTFLAVNQAGLSLLGTTAREKLLGTSLLTMVVEEGREICQSFLDRVSTGHRGSVEVEIVGATGDRHTLELLACKHPGAPDGIASALVTFRDVTEMRGLSQSLVQAATRQSELAQAHETERAGLLTEMKFWRDSQPADSRKQIAALEHELAEVRTHANDREAERQEVLERAAALFDEPDVRPQSLTNLVERLLLVSFERNQALEAAERLQAEHATEAMALRTAAEDALAEQDRLNESLISAKALLNFQQADTDRAGLLAELAFWRDQQPAESQKQIAALEHDLAAMRAGADAYEAERHQARQAVARLEAERAAEAALARALAQQEAEARHADSAAAMAQAQDAHRTEREGLVAELEFWRDYQPAESQKQIATIERNLAEMRTRASAREDELVERLRQADVQRQLALQAADQLQAARAADAESQAQALQESEDRHVVRLAALQAAAEMALAEQVCRTESLERAAAEAEAATAARAEADSANAAEMAAHAARLIELESRVTARETSIAVREAQLQGLQEALIPEVEQLHRTGVHVLRALSARADDTESAVALARQNAANRLADLAEARRAFDDQRQQLEEDLAAALVAERAATEARDTDTVVMLATEHSVLILGRALERTIDDARPPASAIESHFKETS